jgi:putative acetyltransferase
MGSDPSTASRTPLPAPALRVLYRAAFPDEDLLPLLDALARLPDGTCRTVAFVEGGEALAHAHLTACAAGDRRVMLLGPVAVAPRIQGRGLGRALTAAAVKVAEDAAAICVLGDPAFYGRFGFGREDRIRPPFPLPPEWDGAWQSIRFEPVPEAPLSVPPLWDDPALWS